MSDTESDRLARFAADALDDKKALDVILLDVGDLLKITDVFVLATGTSRPHVQSLAEAVEDLLRADDRRPLRREGSAEAIWVLLDYGDVVVHIFQPDAREFYSLERLWGDAPRVEWQPEARPA